MNFFSSLILGLLQGLTEFLPVSSSGHLALMKNLFPNFFQTGVLFYVFLHLGTLFAVCIYFRKEIFSLPIKYYLFLAVATIPAVFIGFFFNLQIETLFTNIKLIGIALLATGIINFFTDGIQKKPERLSYKTSFLTGIAQAVALVPGISRSASTIFASVVQGVSKKSSAKFSFLLSIPAILGANILEVYSTRINNIENFSYYFVGFVASLASGLLAINLVFKFLSKRKFKIFAIYCLLVGIVTIFFKKF